MLALNLLVLQGSHHTVKDGRFPTVSLILFMPRPQNLAARASSLTQRLQNWQAWVVEISPSQQIGRWQIGKIAKDGRDNGNARQLRDVMQISLN